MGSERDQARAAAVPVRGRRGLTVVRSLSVRAVGAATWTGRRRRAMMRCYDLDSA